MSETGDNFWTHNGDLIAPSLFQQLKDREEQLSQYQAHIQEQEKQLNDYRNRLKQEQIKHEVSLQKELESREKLFSDREHKLYARQKEIEEYFRVRQEESEVLRKKLESELISREQKLEEALRELNITKERYTEESRKKIEKTSKDYVSEAISALEEKGRTYHSISKRWSIVGALALASGIGFFVYVSLYFVDGIKNTVTWEAIVFAVFRGVVALAMFAALAKYSFMLSTSYMQEALKNSDRCHAINYGKFYLETYGAAAEWNQVKEAFEQWNIIGTNAFSKQNEPELKASSLNDLVSLVKGLHELLSKPKE